MRPEDAVDDAVDMVGARSGSQTDGEANVGVSQDSEQAPQDAQHDQDDEGRQVEHPGPWQGPPDRGQDRLGRRDDEGTRGSSAGRIEPRQEDPADDEQPEREEGDLEDVREDTHGPSLPALVTRSPDATSRRPGQRWSRSPNRARPTRTIVAPSSTATG